MDKYAIIQKLNDRSRNNAFPTDSTKLYKTHSTPVRGIITLKILSGILPALLFYGCSSHLTDHKQEQAMRLTAEISLRSPMTEKISHIDIFTFRDDDLMRLDSYQRTDEINEDHMEVRSQNGKKIVFICANSRKDIYDWAEINSMTALSMIQSELAEEDRERPVMTGSGKTETGGKVPYIIELSPLVSEIRVRSIRCDFSGMSYEGEKIRNPKIYLTNVNARCPLAEDGKTSLSHIINAGCLVPEDLAGFHDPGIIYQDLGIPIGSTPFNAGISLLCYPNTSLQEGPGTPFTRLVIEGELEGRTYWWPIDINRAKGTSDPGIHRNCSYVYDLVIRRKGSDSPDKTVGIQDMDMEMEVITWNEKEEYSVEF